MYIIITRSDFYIHRNVFVTDLRRTVVFRVRSYRIKLLITKRRKIDALYADI